jgi:hypothetical protein
MRQPSDWTVALALAIAPLGCGDDGGDSEPGEGSGADAAAGELATMSLELLWDAALDSSAFVADDCTRFEWSQTRVSPRSLVAAREEPCADVIDVIEAEPGEYELEITGLDENDEERWSTVCTGLIVADEDVSYDCEIPAE